MSPRCTANSENKSQSSGSSISPSHMSAVFTKPWVPSTARQTMVRAATLRKNGTVKSASVIARIGADRVPLANQRAKGRANSSSIAVTVAAMRRVRSVTDQRPDSKRLR